MLGVENKFMRHCSHFKAVTDMLPSGRLYNRARYYKLSGRWQFKIEPDTHFSSWCPLLDIT